jgi:cyclin D7
MEEVISHSFLPAAVQDMELTLLKALQWRLACVTSYSFLQLLLPLTTPHSTTTTPSRCTRLLIRSLTGN